jgi:F-box and WD-40 domain protein CDC4
MQPGNDGTHSHMLYVPIASPPTPAPSPGPLQTHHYPYDSLAALTSNGSPPIRRQFLTSILATCTPEELLFISASIAPRLKRDFLLSLPTELALYVLSFIDDPRSLVRSSQVSRYWRSLVQEESVWKRLCDVHGFDPRMGGGFPLQNCNKGKRRLDNLGFSHRTHFKNSYITSTFAPSSLR